MIKEETLQQYLTALIHGNRRLCRSIIEQTLKLGIPATTVYLDVIWPIMVEIEKLHREDKITPTQEHLAVRINRTLVDQLQNKLPCHAEKSKKIVICCAPNELQELGAQMLADLFESDGWDVKFLGGGLTNDDILDFVNDQAPDILLIYGTAARQAPDIRKLIDTIKGVNAWPNMKVMVSGGLFNRAEGLWEEIGADLFAENAVEALRLASGQSAAPSQAVPSRTRRKNVRKTELNPEDTLQ